MGGSESVVFSQAQTSRLYKHKRVDPALPQPVMGFSTQDIRTLKHRQGKKVDVAYEEFNFFPNFQSTSFIAQQHAQRQSRY